MTNEKEHTRSRKMVLQLVKGHCLTKERIMQDPNAKKLNYDLSLSEIKDLINGWMQEKPGRTLLELANLSGLTESTLSRILTGKVRIRPHRSTRKAIVDAIIGAKRDDHPIEDAMDRSTLQSIENRLDKLEMALEYLQKQIDLIAGLPHRPPSAGPLNRMQK